MSNNVINSNEVTKRAAVLSVMIIALSAIVFGERVRSLAGGPNSMSPPAEQSSQRNTSFSVNRAQLDRHLVRALDVLGDRFESSAKGRSTLTGTGDNEQAGYHSLSCGGFRWTLDRCVPISPPDLFRLHSNSV